MKKSLVAALTGALVVGATATTFAAANPFSDVPAGHWAYDSVTTLASQGIIEGYGDGTYRGNRNITRYEMAQMVAKALARYPKGSTNISGANRAELEKLAAEFREELDNLGVRVENLERNADLVKWTGKVEYTYHHMEYKPNSGKTKSMNHGGVFRLEPRAEINSHWAAKARLDSEYNGKDDQTFDTKLKRLYVEGDYSKFNVKLGRFGFCPDIEDGLIADTVTSGVQLTFGSKWKGILTVGRAGGGDEPEYAGQATWNARNRDGGTTDDPTDVIALNVQYQPGENGLYGGASYYYAKDDDFNAYRAGEDKASIWAAGLGYKFNDKLDLHGSYARNGKADTQKYGWAADLRYGNYGDYSEKGNWAIWAGYARFGDGVGIVSNQGDDVQTGARGWHVGAAYAPFKNVGLIARYSDGKFIADGTKYKKIFARAEFFF